ncbi:hypothetical protein GGR57DRAFT_502183 [Xylariaceae sp. FL1272]|nr:hypothetical protein GGR57DRAFT_502183 [Xylariaceae sp. FL1272]
MRSLTPLVNGLASLAIGANLVAAKAIPTTTEIAERAAGLVHRTWEYSLTLYEGNALNGGCTGDWIEYLSGFDHCFNAHDVTGFLCIDMKTFDGLTNVAFCEWEFMAGYDCDGDRVNSTILELGAEKRGHDLDQTIKSINVVCAAEG